MAEHIAGNLDARPVADMDIPQGKVWLQLLTPEATGPFPLGNYRYYRIEEVDE